MEQNKRKFWKKEEKHLEVLERWSTAIWFVTSLIAASVFALMRYKNTMSTEATVEAIILALILGFAVFRLISKGIDNYDS